jgi:hypothetical protein
LAKRVASAFAKSRYDSTRSSLTESPSQSAAAALLWPTILRFRPGRLWDSFTMHNQYTPTPGVVGLLQDLAQAKQITVQPAMVGRGTLVVLAKRRACLISERLRKSPGGGQGEALDDANGNQRTRDRPNNHLSVVAR